MEGKIFKSEGLHSAKNIILALGSDHFLYAAEIFFTVKLTALQLLMIFFSITVHFRCVLKERTVVLLCKYVKFYFGMYRSKTKLNLCLTLGKFYISF